MIGKAIITESISRKIRVAAVVRGKSSRIDSLNDYLGNEYLEIIKCEINDYDNLLTKEKYDAFFHLAWQSTDAESRDDVNMHSHNIRYTLDAVAAAHRFGCKTFVCAGSQAEYGIVTEILSGRTNCNPESGYGIAKYAAGKMARLSASQFGMKYCHTRILSTYGEGMDDKTLIIYLIKALLSGEKPSLTKCEQLWDYMHVRDTARALLAVAEKGIDGKTYPVGSGIAKRLREYVEIIRDSIDPSIELGFGEKEYYQHQPMFLCADIAELHADTGFIPTISFDEGIRMTIDWVKSRMKEQG